jgi:protein subunit release factor A
MAFIFITEESGINIYPEIYPEISVFGNTGSPAMMLSPLTTQEAELSSKIEGTQPTVDEILEQEAGLIKEEEYGIHKQTTLGLLRQLKDKNILLELQSGSGRRAATLCFTKLVNRAEGHKVL